MLTLLVRPLEADALALQREILRALAAIVDETSGAVGPIRAENMRFVWPPRGLRAEGRSPCAAESPMLCTGSASGRSRGCRRSRSASISGIGAYDAPAYRAQLQRNSDHRKITDTLHMVLDCTAAESVAIEAYLAELHARGRIAYGTHRADRAMTTCLVFSCSKRAATCTSSTARMAATRSRPSSSRRSCRLAQFPMRGHRVGSLQRRADREKIALVHGVS